MKKSQSSTKSPAKRKDVRAWEEYYDIYSFQMKPVNMSVKERFAEDLRDWSLKDDSLRIEDFVDERGFNLMTYYRWQETCEALKMAHEFAIRRLASRREKGAITKKYDSTSIFKSQHWYDAVYREAAKAAAALREENNSQEQKIVIMHEYTKTDKS